MAKVEELSKDSRVQEKINKEKERLNNIFNELPDAQLKTAKTLVDNASFMTVILDELAEHIAEHGTVSEYKNGANQWGTKISPETQNYNSMIKNHSVIMRQLNELLKGHDIEGVDEFDKFISRR